MPPTDSPRSTVTVAWRADGSGGQLAEHFRETAEATRDREAELVRMLEHDVSVD